MHWTGRFELKDNLSGGAPYQATALCLTEEGGDLVAEFIVSDTHIQSFGEKYNDPLWKGDVVEVFLSTSENRYFEAELNPNGIGYAFMVENKDGLGDIVLTPLDTPPFTATVTRTETGWKGVYRFSKTALKALGIPANTTANFYRQDYQNETIYLSALSPTGKANFHIPKSFLSMEVTL